MRHSGVVSAPRAGNCTSPVGAHFAEGVDFGRPCCHSFGVQWCAMAAGEGRDPVPMPARRCWGGPVTRRTKTARSRRCATTIVRRLEGGVGRHLPIVVNGGLREPARGDRGAQLVRTAVMARARGLPPAVPASPDCSGRCIPGAGRRTPRAECAYTARMQRYAERAKHRPPAGASPAITRHMLGLYSGEPGAPRLTGRTPE